MIRLDSNEHYIGKGNFASSVPLCYNSHKHYGYGMDNEYMMGMARTQILDRKMKLF